MGVGQGYGKASGGGAGTGPGSYEPSARLVGGEVSAAWGQASVGTGLSASASELLSGWSFVGNQKVRKSINTYR